MNARYKRILAGLAVAILLAVLTACAAPYESTDYHFTMQFPADMAVLVPGVTPADDPALAEYDISYDALTAFKESEGGVFYAVGKRNGVYREVLVNVQQTTYSQTVWQLKEHSPDVAEFQQELIDGFAEEGVQVVQKGQFPQGRAYGVYLNISSAGNGQIDTVYFCTIYNGLQYTIFYQASAPMDDALIQESQDLFDTFLINKTLPDPNAEVRDTTTLQAVLVVGLILIAAALVALPLRAAAKRKRARNEERPYVPQFEDDLRTRADHNKKKDRS